jgi:hypothetical protein
VRKRKKADLTRRLLKPDAVPGIYPNLPGYLSSAPSTSRTTSSTCAERLGNENGRIQQQEAIFLEKDTIKSLDDLKMLFVNCQNRPSGFQIYSHTPFSITFVAVDFIAIPPRLTGAVEVHESLHFDAYKNDALVNYRQLATVMKCSNKVDCFLDFLNLLAFLKYGTPIPDFHCC